MKIAYFV